MKRGEVWLINLDPTVGAEIRKTRPVVIVSSDAVGILPLRVIIPLSDWKDRYEGAPWMVKVEPNTHNGLEKTYATDTFQVRSISHERFVCNLGSLDARIMTLISNALGLVLEI